MRRVDGGGSCEAGMSFAILYGASMEGVAAPDAGPLSRARTVLFQPRECCPTLTRGPLPRLNLVLPARPRKLGPASFSMQRTISSSNYQEEPTNIVFIMHHAPTQFPLPLMSSTQFPLPLMTRQQLPLPLITIKLSHKSPASTLVQVAHTYLNWYY